INAGAGAFTLTLNGSNFVPTSQVVWNGSGRATTYVGFGQLTAAILASDLTGINSATVTVVTPAPGGGTSVNLSIAIVANPTPTLASILPVATLAGSPALTLTVTGTGFVGASNVQWNGVARPTTYVSSTQLTSMIPGSDL